jgi:hypothetical protein
VKPWPVGQWCLAPTADPACGWQMEDVPDGYHRPLDPLRPVGCLDEPSRHRLGAVRPPLLAGPGQPARHDPGDVRGGVANPFVLTEPLRGWRTVRVSDQRTRLDFAACIKDPVDVHCPQAARIVLGLDRLTTRSPASPSAAFPPAAAKRLMDKREIHQTPKHGPWLNMAELALGVLQRQCLRPRLADRDAMEREGRAWVRRRTHQPKPLDWRFTTADARLNLRRLFPAVED